MLGFRVKKGDKLSEMTQAIQSFTELSRAKFIAGQVVALSTWVNPLALMISSLLRRHCHTHWAQRSRRYNLQGTKETLQSRG